MTEVLSLHQGKVFIIPYKSKKVIIRVNDILYVRAECNYSVFVLDDQTELIWSKTLEYVENNIIGQTFFRCHRSYLVRIDKIREIARQKSEITMKGNVRVPIARRKRKDLLKAVLESEKSTVYSEKNTVYSKISTVY